MKKNFLGGLRTAVAGMTTFVPHFFGGKEKTDARRNDSGPAKQTRFLNDPSIVTPTVKYCLLCGKMHAHHNTYCCVAHAYIYKAALTALRKFRYKKFIPHGETSKVFAMFTRGNGKINGVYSKSAFKIVLRENFPRIVIPDVIG
jgi:hypothetical protein